jgi:hypothetical protein
MANFEERMRSKKHAKDSIMEKYLSRAVTDILVRIEEKTGLAVPRPFVTFVDTTDRLRGYYKPGRFKAAEGWETGLICLRFDALESAEAFMSVLAHEIIHAAEAVEMELGNPHGKFFNRLRAVVGLDESDDLLLDGWAANWIKDNGPLPLQIDYSSVIWVGGRKEALRVYACGCASVVKTDPVDLHCNRCGIDMELVNDPNEDMALEVHLRRHELERVAAVVASMPPATLRRVSPGGLVRILERVVIDDGNTESCEVSAWENDEARLWMSRLWRHALELQFIEGQTSSADVRYILHTLKGK